MPFDAARDPKVSSHHAEFLYEDGCWFVVDTASTNGTLIDGERVTKVAPAAGRGGSDRRWSCSGKEGC